MGRMKMSKCKNHEANVRTWLPTWVGKGGEKHDFWLSKDGVVNPNGEIRTWVSGWQGPEKMKMISILHDLTF
jgi:hypothetical protein